MPVLHIGAWHRKRFVRIYINELLDHPRWKYRGLAQGRKERLESGRMSLCPYFWMVLLSLFFYWPVMRPWRAISAWWAKKSWHFREVVSFILSLFYIIGFFGGLFIALSVRDARDERRAAIAKAKLDREHEIWRADILKERAVSYLFFALGREEYNNLGGTERELKIREIFPLFQWADTMPRFFLEDEGMTALLNMDSRTRASACAEVEAMMKVLVSKDASNFSWTYSYRDLQELKQLPALERDSRMKHLAQVASWAARTKVDLGHSYSYVEMRERGYLFGPKFEEGLTLLKRRNDLNQRREHVRVALNVRNLEDLEKRFPLSFEVDLSELDKTERALAAAEAEVARIEAAKTPAATPTNYRRAFVSASLNAAVFALFICFILGVLRFRRSALWRDTRSLIAAFYKAKKERVCPFLEFEKDPPPNDHPLA